MVTTTLILSSHHMAYHLVFSIQEIVITRALRCCIFPLLLNIKTYGVQQAVFFLPTPGPGCPGTRLAKIGQNDDPGGGGVVGGWASRQGPPGPPHPRGRTFLLKKTAWCTNTRNSPLTGQTHHRQVSSARHRQGVPTTRGGVCGC